MRKGYFQCELKKVISKKGLNRSFTISLLLLLWLIVAFTRSIKKCVIRWGFYILINYNILQQKNNNSRFKIVCELYIKTYKVSSKKWNAQGKGNKQQKEGEKLWTDDGNGSSSSTTSRYFVTTIWNNILRLISLLYN